MGGWVTGASAASPGPGAMTLGEVRAHTGYGGSGCWLVLRKKMTGMIADSQFQTTAERVSNLDRCNACGTPRSAHGIDWTCPAGTSHQTRRFGLLAGFAAILALPGIAVLTASSQTSMTPGTLAASACLVALTLLVCGLSVVIRRL